jgi:hypothetical protein
MFALIASRCLGKDTCQPTSSTEALRQIGIEPLSTKENVKAYMRMMLKNEQVRHSPVWGNYPLFCKVFFNISRCVMCLIPITTLALPIVWKFAPSFVWLTFFSVLMCCIYVVGILYCTYRNNVICDILNVASIKWRWDPLKKVYIYIPKEIRGTLYKAQNAGLNVRIATLDTDPFAFVNEIPIATWGNDFKPSKMY